ncbi:hypothetical protein DFJ77DRAFT_447972 [Powellomyces hirtus]|nr:hypothetical protein DFJ77DRAFT_447972 [Powellomyces hirtus]
MAQEQVSGNQETAGQKSANFYALPREIWLAILDLTPVKDLLYSRSVSRAWWLDSMRAVARRLNVRGSSGSLDSDRERVRALLCADGEWHEETLKAGDLSCTKVTGLEEVFADKPTISGNLNCQRLEDVRFTFGPADNQWPILGYFVNAEGTLSLTINGRFTEAFEDIDSQTEKKDVQRDADGWSIAYSLRKRPDIVVGSAMADGVPTWFNRRLAWGMPDDVYYCEVEVERFEVGVKSLMFLLA